MSTTGSDEPVVGRGRTVLRLSIYLGNADSHHHRALSGEVLHRAHAAGLAGATTLQGVEGYGHTQVVHTTPHWRARDRTPVTIHIIDQPARIRGFLPLLADLADQCLIVCDEVEVHNTRGSS